MVNAIVSAVANTQVAVAANSTNLAGQLGCVMSMMEARNLRERDEAWGKIKAHSSELVPHSRWMEGLEMMPKGCPLTEEGRHFNDRLLFHIRPVLDASVVSAAREPLSHDWPVKHGFRGAVDIEDTLMMCVDRGIVSERPAQQLIESGRQFVDLKGRAERLTLGMAVWDVKHLISDGGDWHWAKKLYPFFFKRGLDDSILHEAREGEEQDDYAKRLIGVLSPVVRSEMESIYFGDDTTIELIWRRGMGPGTLKVAEELGLIESAQRYMEVQYAHRPESMPSFAKRSLLDRIRGRRF